MTCVILTNHDQIIYGVIQRKSMLSVITINKKLYAVVIIQIIRSVLLVSNISIESISFVRL
jgi:hypothetical protein